MKWLMRIVILGVLIAALAFPMLIKKKDGSAMMKLEDLIPVPPKANTATNIAYKWKDAEGRTVYSDQPPSDQPWEILNVDPKVNLLQGTRKPEGTSGGDSPSMVPGLTANPLNVLQQAKEAKAAMENRTPPP